MTTNTNQIRLVIHVEGGIVQAIYSNSSAPIQVAIQDFDIEGADGDEIAMLNDGTEFIGHIEAIIHNDSCVADVFAAFDEEYPVIDKQQENYVARDGQFCPNCGANNVQANVGIEADGLSAWGRVGCSECESTWMDQYRLVGFDNLEATPLKEISSVAEVFTHELS